MIKKWHLQGFKSKTDSAPLELAPLTILTGTNSSGKSTVIQSMLVMKQTMETPIAKNYLRLNGALAKLGTHSDIFSAKSRMQIGLETDNGACLNVHYAPAPEIKGEPSYPILEAVELKSGSADGEALTKIERTTEEAKAKISARIPPGRMELDDFSYHVTDVRHTYDKYSSESMHGEFLMGATINSFIPTKFSELLMPGSKRETASRIADLDNCRLAEQREFLDHVSKVLFVRFPRPQIADGFKETIQRTMDQLGSGITGGRQATFHKLEKILKDSGLPQAALKEIQGFFKERSIPLSPGIRDLDNTSRTLQETFLIHISGTQMDVESTRKAHREITKLKTKIRSGKPTDFYKFEKLILNLNISDVERAKIADFFNSHIAPRLRSEQEPCVVDSSKRGTPIGVTLSNLLAAAGSVSKHVSAIKYLGPLRDNPRLVYPESEAFDPKDVGVRGEHTASAIGVNENLPVDPLLLPSEYPYQDIKGETLEFRKVLEAWLQHLQIAKSVRPQPVRGLGYTLEIILPNSSKPCNMANVGVGVSQALPILVFALLSDKKSTLIFEQPELHLHPKTQSLLADFFFTLAMSGRQCVIETHSEHIINRLRYLAAKHLSPGKANPIAENTLVYFVEKKDGASVYRPIRIDNFGNIPEWPADFFDEAALTEAAIVNAGLKKRRLMGIDR